MRLEQEIGDDEGNIACGYDKNTSCRQERDCDKFRHNQHIKHREVCDIKSHGCRQKHETTPQINHANEKNTGYHKHVQRVEEDRQAANAQTNCCGHQVHITLAEQRFDQIDHLKHKDNREYRAQHLLILAILCHDDTRTL